MCLHVPKAENVMARYEEQKTAQTGFLSERMPYIFLCAHTILTAEYTCTHFFVRTKLMLMRSAALSFNNLSTMQHHSSTQSKPNGSDGVASPRCPARVVCQDAPISPSEGRHSSTRYHHYTAQLLAVTTGTPCEDRTHRHYSASQHIRAWSSDIDPRVEVNPKNCQPEASTS